MFRFIIIIIVPMCIPCVRNVHGRTISCFLLQTILAHSHIFCTLVRIFDRLRFQSDAKTRKIDSPLSTIYSDENNFDDKNNICTSILGTISFGLRSFLLQTKEH